jgi:hypothetical protein
MGFPDQTATTFCQAIAAIHAAIAGVTLVQEGTRNLSDVAWPAKHEGRIDSNDNRQDTTARP